MGWELNFNSYEKNPDGRGYNMDQPTAFKKVIGKMDDVPIEKVAAEIVKQMARRDVFVEVDKIFEYTKKEISFREGKGSLIIKGQKFSLDGIPLEQEVAPYPCPIATAGFYHQPGSDTHPQNSIELQESESLPSSLLGRMGKRVDSIPQTQDLAAAANLRILRVELFDPDQPDFVVKRLFEKGMVFTVGKKYPVFEEIKKEIMTVSQDRGQEISPALLYKVTDDKGKIVEVSSTYFRLPTPGLTFLPPQLNQTKAKEAQPKLLYMGNVNYGGESTNINVGADDGRPVSIRRGV